MKWIIWDIGRKKRTNRHSFKLNNLTRRERKTSTESVLFKQLVYTQIDKDEDAERIKRISSLLPFDWWKRKVTSNKSLNSITNRRTRDRHSRLRGPQPCLVIAFDGTCAEGWQRPTNSGHSQESVKRFAKIQTNLSETKWSWTFVLQKSFNAFELAAAEMSFLLKKENASVTVRQPWNVAVISNHRSRKSNRPWKNELWLHRSVWLSHYTVLFTFCFKRRRKQNVNQRFGSWNREAQLGLISMLIAVNWMQTSSWSIELAGIVLNAQFNRSFLKIETDILSEIWRFIKFIHFAF